MTETETSSLALLLQIVNTQVRATVVGLAEAQGLRMVDVRILLVLGEREGLTQVEIARELAANKTFVMRAINDLEEKALVERRKTGADSRANYIYLTPQGRSTLAQAQEIFSLVDKGLSSSLTQTEANALVYLLSKLRQVLRESGPLDEAVQRIIPQK